jgi:hypothetical protein
MISSVVYSVRNKIDAPLIQLLVNVVGAVIVGGCIIAWCVLDLMQSYGVASF